MTKKLDNRGESVIVAEDVRKAFQLPHEQQSGVKQILLGLTKKGRKNGFETQQVLRGLSFEIKKGDFFGIVGRNGSGKSTLLKLLAGIYTPDSGKIDVKGSLIPFIELGVGFNPELTGRENVFLNGALLGFSRKEMEGMYEEIVEFAELQRFMDQKLKNYSSGMQVRLAFSIAIKARGDILILDEVLAVGDEAFQRKCEDFFDQIKKDKSKTVILVTHSMGSVRKYCNKAMMIHKGKIVVVGSPEDVANEYSLENLNIPAVITTKSEEKEKPVEPVIKNFSVDLLSPKQISQDDRVVVRYSVISNKDTQVKVVTDLCSTEDNCGLYCFDSPMKQIKSGIKTTFEASFDISPFNNMRMNIRSSIRDNKGNLMMFSSDANSPQFIVRRSDYKDNKSPQAGIIFKNGRNVKWQ